MKKYLILALLSVIGCDPQTNMVSHVECYSGGVKILDMETRDNVYIYDGSTTVIWVDRKVVVQSTADCIVHDEPLVEKAPEAKEGAE